MVLVYLCSIITILIVVMLLCYADIQFLFTKNITINFKQQYISSVCKPNQANLITVSYIADFSNLFEILI